MKVRMLVQPVGEQPNGQPWPPTGSVVDLEADQAAEFIRIRWAQPVDDQTAGDDGDGGEEMPTTTAQKLIEWVGTDPDRAERARAAELDRRHPRKSVLDALDAVEEASQAGQEAQPA